MSDHFHAIVWIDHHEARVFHFNADDAARDVVQATNPHSHIHHKANAGDSGHAPEDQAFYHAVVQALGAAGAVLITGPANARLELVKHIQKHDAALAAKIAGVESLDHPSDGVLLAHARKYFHAADRMAPQRS